MEPRWIGVLGYFTRNSFSNRVIVRMVNNYYYYYYFDVLVLGSKYLVEECCRFQVLFHLLIYVFHIYTLRVEPSNALSLSYIPSS